MQMRVDKSDPPIRVTRNESVIVTEGNKLISIQVSKVLL